MNQSPDYRGNVFSFASPRNSHFELAGRSPPIVRGYQTQNGDARPGASNITNEYQIMKNGVNWQSSPLSSTPNQSTASARMAQSPTYSSLVNPAARTVRLLRASGRAGELKGVGISFVKDMRNGLYGPFMITQTIPQSPADLCGHITAGDALFAVDGVTVLDKSADQVSSLILGPPNTPVVLSVAPRQRSSPDNTNTKSSSGNHVRTNVNGVRTEEIDFRESSAYGTKLSASMWQVISLPCLLHTPYFLSKRP